VHPRTRSASSSQSKSQFLGQFLLGGLDLEVYLDRLLMATTKKRSSNFFDDKKCTPDKILVFMHFCSRGISTVVWRRHSSVSYNGEVLCRLQYAMTGVVNLTEFQTTLMRCSQIHCSTNSCQHKNLAVP